MTYRIGLSFAIRSLPKVTNHFFYCPFSKCSPEQVEMLIPCSRWWWSFFLWFLSRHVFSKGTRKWAGYEVPFASIFHLSLSVIRGGNSYSFMWFNERRKGDNHCNLFPGSEAYIASTTVCGLSACSLVYADIQHLNPWLKMRRTLNMEKVHIPIRKRRRWCRIRGTW
jgi:hypothetical protein